MKLDSGIGGGTAWTVLGLLRVFAESTWRSVKYC